LVFKRVPQVSVNEISLEEFETLSNTSRGSGGFGSTGK
jgi:dUTPase